MTLSLKWLIVMVQEALVAGSQRPICFGDYPWANEEGTFDRNCGNCEWFDKCQENSS